MKAIAYLWVPLDKNELIKQTTRVRDYCISQNIRDVKFYSDALGKKKMFELMLRHFEKGDRDTLIIYDKSLLSIDEIRKIEGFGVRIISVRGEDKSYA